MLHDLEIINNETILHFFLLKLNVHHFSSCIMHTDVVFLYFFFDVQKSKNKKIPCMPSDQKNNASPQ